jgi:RNA polymerase sigma-70 factor (ECF subfamily)
VRAVSPIGAVELLAVRDYPATESSSISGSALSETGSAAADGGAGVEVVEESQRGRPNNNRREDDAIIARVLKGDRPAFRTLVEKYERRAYSIAFQILRNEEDARDVVQESFVKAFLSLAQFEAKAGFYTWLYRIVFNMAVDMKRKLSRRENGAVSLDSEDRVKVEGDAALQSPVSESPLEKLSRREDVALLDRAMSSLSDEHRTVLVLREIDGLSYEEIAVILKISKGTVMSRLHYARKRLHEVLAGESASESHSAQGHVSKGAMGKISAPTIKERV